MLSPQRLHTHITSYSPRKYSILRTKITRAEGEKLNPLRPFLSHPLCFFPCFKPYTPCKDHKPPSPQRHTMRYLSYFFGPQNKNSTHAEICTLQHTTTPLSCMHGTEARPTGVVACACCDAGMSVGGDFVWVTMMMRIIIRTRLE